MKRNNKKGFTIVELVIVIAVIAILAAVLIPTFSSVIKKAKVNNDIQLVRNLNTALATENKKHATMQDALDAAAKFGYDVDKINNTSASENEILWDSVNDCFVYKKSDGSMEYVPNSKTEEPASYQLWQICNAMPETQTYSIYAGNGWTTATVDNLKVGFDAGTTKGITSIEYKNTTATPQNVVIRTNSFNTTLTINDSSTQGKIYHYDNLGKLIITDCAMESYHEMGTVGYAELKNGHLAVEENASINLLFANSENSANLKITNNGTITNAQASSDSVEGSNTISGVDFNRENAATVSNTDIQQAVQETHQSNCEHANVEVSKKAVEATCTQKGSTVEKKCHDCNKILVEQQEIPMLQHTLTHYDAVPATCNQNGNVEYNHCSVCNKNYADNGDLLENVVKKATGEHNYDSTHKCTVCEADEPGWEGFGGKVDANGRLKDGVFENTDITSIIIPEGVTEIGNSAFKNCTNLTSVTISSTVERIGEQAFQGCSNLKSVTIPSTVKIVSKNAFYECTKLNSLTILNGVESIQNSAFGYCSNLQSVTIPSSVTYIGESAFCNCTSLTSVVIQSSAEIQRGVFQNCTSLLTIELHSTKVKDAVFAGCTSLRSVKFGAEVTDITANAFSNTPIETVEVDTQNTKYKHDVDKDCVLADNGDNGKTLVLGCVKTTIPSTVTKIGTYSFHGRNITSITIPSSVETIEQFAFKGSSLTSVTFEGITSSARWSLSPFQGANSVGYNYLSDQSTIANYLKTNYAACKWTRTIQ